MLGVEETDSVIFNEADDDTLDIYISFNGSIQAVVENQLSEKFIQFCGIPENRHRIVRPILSFPLENLRHFLDENGLDVSVDRPYLPTNDSQIGTEVNEEIERALLIDDIREVTSTPRTPNSGRHTAFLPLATEDLRQSSLLRERIPTLDESIAVVRRAAALPNTAPTLIITPSRVLASPSNLGLGSNNNANNTISPGAENEQTSPQPRTSHPRDSSTLSTEVGSEVVGSALDMTDLQATFSEVLSIETSSRTSLMTSTQVFSPSSLSRSPRTSGLNLVPEPERSMLGLHRQHIGLLGEIFVSQSPLPLSSFYSFISDQRLAVSRAKQRLGPDSSLDEPKPQCYISRISIQRQ